MDIDKISFIHSTQLVHIIIQTHFVHIILHRHISDTFKTASRMCNLICNNVTQSLHV
jgi:hypothetical protein